VDEQRSGNTCNVHRYIGDVFVPDTRWNIEWSIIKYLSETS